jgi:ketosteroid isomerase-like protein
MQEGNELVRAIIAAFNHGDVEGMLSRMDPGFEWRPLEASPVARLYHGHEDVRRYVEDWLTTFEGVRLDLEDLTDLGDRVVAAVHGHARGRASGLQLDSHFCQVWTVSGGTAIAMEEHPTREEALARLRQQQKSLS